MQTHNMRLDITRRRRFYIFSQSIEMYRHARVVTDTSILQDNC